MVIPSKIVIMTEVITDYKKALSMYKNKTIEFSQRSLKEVASKYTGVISEKDRQISNLMDHNESLEIEANSLRYELNKISTEKEAEIKALKSENSKLTELLARRDTEFTDEAEQKIKTGLLKEYADLEQLKKQYSSSYEEIATEVSENIRAELDAKYKEYNSALKDGHDYMQKRVKCPKRYLKYINSLGGVTSAELPDALKCPNISNGSLQAYMNEYLEVAVHTCGKCNKYE